MNIIVVGPGAIGSLWAYHLKQAGHNLSVWARSDSHDFHLQVDNKPQIQLINRGHSLLKQTDLVLITTKAWQAKNALLPLIPSLSSQTILLFMHNGMGAIEHFLEQIDQFPILMATTTHGALRCSPEHVLHTGKGTTQIGAFNSKGNQCPFIADVFHHALPDTFWNQNINQALWVKLAINCVINPLTALEQCKNGELNNTRFQKRLELIIEEVVSVMDAEGYSEGCNALMAQVQSVIRATAPNYSSMHQDIHNNRKTEIDYITGYLLIRAQAHGLSLPENQKLYQAIKKMESGRTPQ
jgi:2-dehydropantoate 2-reductase